MPSVSLLCCAWLALSVSGASLAFDLPTEVTFDENGLAQSFGFRPRSTFEQPDYSGPSSRSTDPEAVLHDFMSQQGFKQDSYAVQRTTYSNLTDVTHFQLQAMHNGVAVDNAIMKVAIDGNYDVTTASLVLPENQKPRSGLCRPRTRLAPSKMTLAGAVQVAADFIQRPDLVKAFQAASPDSNAPSFRLADTSPIASDAIESVGPSLLYTANGIVNTYKIQASFGINVASMHVNQATDKVIHLDNLTTAFHLKTYTEEGPQNPEEGDPVLFDQTGPSNLSPFGWFNDGHTDYQETRGNNAIVQVNPNNESWLKVQRPKATNGAFNFPYTKGANATENANAGAVFAFYWVNAFHDWAKIYGFTSSAGNFEVTSQNGKGQDPVIVNTQDGSGFNNANYATPPDGSQPKMRLYLWKVGSRTYDGAECGDVVIHEAAHGASVRMTSSTNSGCLASGEGAGLGEGWSDIVSIIWRIRPGDDRTKNFGMGVYCNGGRSVRKYLYSTNTDTNPLAFDSLNNAEFQKVHTMGLVWASILYEVLWEFNDALGIDSIWSGSTTMGNTLFTHILFQSWSIQGCNVNFMSAREAMFEAERQISQGKYRCLMWKGFAKRGMGVDASHQVGGRFNAGTQLPKECQGV